MTIHDHDALFDPELACVCNLKSQSPLEMKKQRILNNNSADRSCFRVFCTNFHEFGNVLGRRVSFRNSNSWIRDDDDCISRFDRLRRQTEASQVSFHRTVRLQTMYTLSEADCQQDK